MRSRAFVDVAKTLRPWIRMVDRKPAPTDARGWPTRDATTALVDVRPAFAWAPPMDDPDACQPDWRGTYHLTFQGKAEVGVAEDRRSRVEGLSQDAAANTTNGRVVVPEGEGLLALTLTTPGATRQAPRDRGSPASG